MAFRIPFGMSHSLPKGSMFSPNTLKPFSFRSLHLPRPAFSPVPGPSRIPSPSFSSNAFFTSQSQRLSSTSPSSSASGSAWLVARRAFNSSSKGLIRSSYFPRNSGSGGGGYGSGGGGGGGWFSNLRRRIDRIPTMTLVYGLIGINGGVFLLWQYALSSAQRFRDPTLFFFLQKNFVLNEINVFSGRIWTLVTSAFSHMSGSHIFVNCLGLYFLAPAAASIMGSSAFLGLYLGAGIFSSLTSLAYHRFMKDRWYGSEGASGAIYACLSFYGATFPQSTVLMFFVIPMPVWVAISGIFAWDFYSAIFRPTSGTDSAGHLGGIIYGLGAAMAFRRGGLMRMFRGGARRPRW